MRYRNGGASDLGTREGGVGTTVDRTGDGRTVDRDDARTAEAVPGRSVDDDDDDGKPVARAGRTDADHGCGSPMCKYLRMGWHGARCIWRQHNRHDSAASADEQLGLLVAFWATIVGCSVALLWAAFGWYHEQLFGLCAVATSPAAAYAMDVNKYLTTVPPHVVVTDKGKMFAYRPTVEERFLWRTAKKMANFHA